MSLDPVKHHISIAVYCCDLWRPWLVVVPTISGQPVCCTPLSRPSTEGVASTSILSVTYWYGGLAQRGFPAPIHLSDQLPQCNLFNRPCKVRIAIQSTNLAGRAICSTDQAFKQASRALVQYQAQILLGEVWLFFCFGLMHPKFHLDFFFWELFYQYLSSGYFPFNHPIFPTF